MPSQEILNQKNSALNAAQVSETSLELVPHHCDENGQPDPKYREKDQQAIAKTGQALRNLGNYQLALKQYRIGRELQPKNSEFQREEAFHLSRLKRYDEAVVQAELEKIENQEEAIASQKVEKPPQVLLFSGHMIDSPNRPQPRFPAAMETEAQQKIKEVLDQLQADASDLAIAPGIACGGDTLFLEACLERQMKVEVYLPFEPAEFIEQSVSFAGDDWVERFYKIKNHPQVKIHLQLERIGPVPEGDNPFERNNRWALYSSLIYGIDRVRLVVLWDGKGGDGRGGTGDMVKQVRQLGGIVEHLDTTKFDYWKAEGKGRGNKV